MQNSVLDFIFNNDEDIGSIIVKDKEYKRLSGECYGLYDKLIEMLDKDQAEIFEKFAELTLDCGGIGNEIYFKEGFKSGLRLAIECLID